MGSKLSNEELAEEFEEYEENKKMRDNFFSHGTRKKSGIKKMRNISETKKIKRPRNIIENHEFL